jgi:hypothetical protein
MRSSTHANVYHDVHSSTLLLGARTQPRCKRRYRKPTMELVFWTLSQKADSYKVCRVQIRFAPTLSNDLRVL